MNQQSMLKQKDHKHYGKQKTHVKKLSTNSI